MMETRDTFSGALHFKEKCVIRMLESNPNLLECLSNGEIFFISLPPLHASILHIRAVAGTRERKYH